MKRQFRWIIPVVIAVVIALFVTLIIVQKKKDARPFNVYDYPESITVTNGTEFEKADTLALILADKIFDLDTLDLMIYYIPDVVNSGDMEFYGIVQHLPFGKSKFLILLNKRMSLSKLKETLSHEFIHIDQYDSGDLVVIGDSFCWKGESGNFSETKYDIRPFEKVAFSNQGKITKELNKLLYE